MSEKCSNCDQLCLKLTEGAECVGRATPEERDAIYRAIIAEAQAQSTEQQPAEQPKQN